MVSTSRSSVGAGVAIIPAAWDKQNGAVCTLYVTRFWSSGTEKREERGKRQPKNYRDSGVRVLPGGHGQREKTKKSDMLYDVQFVSCNCLLQRLVADVKKRYFDTCMHQIER